MIVGIGLDVVDIARFGLLMTRTPRMCERLFTPSERGLPMRSLAARFAGKEAIAKALGSPPGMSWQDVTIARGPEGAPSVHVLGSVAARLAEVGGTRILLSLTHDGGVAAAIAVVEAPAHAA